MIGDDRVAGFSPTEEYFAKGCFGVNGLYKLPNLNDKENNFLIQLFNNMQNNIVSESLIFEEEKAAYNRAMEEGSKLVGQIIGAEAANLFAAELDKIKHSLTSRKEISAMARAKIAELGLKWNKGAKMYEVSADTNLA
jgi:hypothetical protein